MHGYYTRKRWLLLEFQNGDTFHVTSTIQRYMDITIIKRLAMVKDLCERDKQAKVCCRINSAIMIGKLCDIGYLSLGTKHKLEKTRVNCSAYDKD